MEILIYDLAHLEGSSDPNPSAMFISSFHKQSGDHVVLAEEKEIALYNHFDLKYVFKGAADKLPPIGLLMSKNTRIVDVPHFINWELPPVMLALRPDYLLYPQSSINVLQFTDNKGNLLPWRQKQDITARKQRSVFVCDSNLWLLPKKDLISVLNTLLTKKNIYFLNEILLTRVLDDKDIKTLFYRLKLDPKRQQQYSPLALRLDNILAVLEICLYKKRKRFNKEGFYFQVNAQFKKIYAAQDWNRMIAAIDLLKGLGLPARIEVLGLNSHNDIAQTYRLLENWNSKQNRYLSFIQYITQDGSLTHQNDPSHWNTKAVKIGRQLIQNYIKNGGNLMTFLKQWRTRSLDPAKVNWAALKGEIWQ